MKRNISSKHTVAIAKIMFPGLKRLMSNYTWQECLKFTKREREYYNENNGYGAISDHFLLAANKLKLDV